MEQENKKENLTLETLLKREFVRQVLSEIDEELEQFRKTESFKILQNIQVLVEDPDSESGAQKFQCTLRSFLYDGLVCTKIPLKDIKDWDVNSYISLGKYLIVREILKRDFDKVLIEFYNKIKKVLKNDEKKVDDFGDLIEL